MLNFIRETYSKAQKTQAVIAISGGIDSAVSLTLLARAFKDFPKNNIFPVFLPYGDQNMSDAKEIVSWNGIPAENWQEINIEPMVKEFAKNLGIEKTDLLDSQKKIRLGNIMARVRMIIIYDLAKKLNALVCGTENKSEKYLGYFTRFGDGASDLEPIMNLYKTQVRELAKKLDLPDKFLKKTPTADLWEQQTDEQELGFSYRDADKVLVDLIDHQKDPVKIIKDGVKGLESVIVRKVLDRVEIMKFKLQVPYELPH